MTDSNKRRAQDVTVLNCLRRSDEKGDALEIYWAQTCYSNRGSQESRSITTCYQCQLKEKYYQG
jgi:hypothetical protein